MTERRNQHDEGNKEEKPLPKTGGGDIIRQVTHVLGSSPELSEILGEFGDAVFNNVPGPLGKKKEQKPDKNHDPTQK